MINNEGPTSYQDKIIKPLELPELKVQNSGLIELPFFNDKLDGVLVIVEGERTIPFEIKRLYTISGFNGEASIRGKHAHHKLNQYIICTNGSFKLSLDDGATKQDVSLNNPSVAVRLGPMLWHEMSDFSPDCSILVVADDYYNEADYIRDYAEFSRLVKTKEPESVE